MTNELRFVTRIGVYGVAIEDRSILLIKKQGGCYKDLLDLPGGGVEFGETPEETLRREFCEEVGMTFDRMVWMDNLSHNVKVLNDEDPFFFHHLGLIYRLEEIQSVTEVHEEEFEWHNIDAITLLHLTPFARAAVILSSETKDKSWS